MARSSFFSSLSQGILSFNLLGENPTKVKAPFKRPEAEMAVITALGPGITSTRIPASVAAATISAPGSETVGVPASDTGQLPDYYSAC